MIYQLVGVIERQVQESFHIEVEADEESEAQDLAYELMSEYPHSDLVALRLFKTGEAGTKPHAVQVRLVQEVEEESEDEDGDPNSA